jgi:fructose 1,6-bisphosphatase
LLHKFEPIRLDEEEKEYTTVKQFFGKLDERFKSVVQQ